MPRLDILRHRLRAHGLAGAPFDAPADVVRSLGAMQSQEYAVAKWSIAQRTRGVSESRIDDAIADGTILLTHVLRPTWHFVLPADIRWMQQLTAPRVRAMMASADRKIEIDRRVVARSNAVIAKALEGGRHLTRTELAVALRDSGIEAGTQRLAHLVMHAELDALIASGAPRGKQQTYALLDERAPGPTAATAPLERDEALAELASRYFGSHGPATLRDFRWWSSLTAADAKRAVEAAGPRLVHHEADGRSHWAAEPREMPKARHSPTAHLLQVYDEYIVAYRETRDLLSIDPIVQPGFRNGEKYPHAVVLHGRVVGHWRRVAGPASVSIELRLAARVDRSARAAIQKAAERHDRFVGRAPAVFTGAEDG